MLLTRCVKHFAQKSYPISRQSRRYTARCCHPAAVVAAEEVVAVAVAVEVGVAVAVAVADPSSCSSMIGRRLVRTPD